MTTKFEDLSIEEQEKWNAKAKEISADPIKTLYLNLFMRTKCIWCGVNFPDGIIKEKERAKRFLSSYDWFNTEFLFHADTTHGFKPEIIDMFLDNVTKK